LSKKRRTYSVGLCISPISFVIPPHLLTSRRNTLHFITHFYFDFNLYKNTIGGSDYQKRGETKKSYDLISQLKKILGGKFNRVYKASKEKIDDFNKQLYSTQNGQRNADIANAIIRLPGILSEIDGIIYTGFVDGNSSSLFQHFTPAVFFVFDDIVYHSQFYDGITIGANPSIHKEIMDIF
jgi:hypothetical protein